MAEICLILHGYILVNDIKPKKYQIVPPDGCHVQTTFLVSNQVPIGIHVEEGVSITFISFDF